VRSHAPAPESVSRILVIRLSALGDVIRTLPLLPPLKARYPAARIAWLCEPANRPVLDRQPLLDEILEFPRASLARDLARGRLPATLRTLRQVARSLRQRRFDLVLDAQGTYKSLLLTRLTGGRMRVGFVRGAAKEYLPGLLTHRVSPPPGPLSRVEKALGLLAPLQGDPELAAASLPENRLESLEATRLWTAAGSSPRILIGPGASPRQDYKRWPARRFGELAAALAGQGMTVRLAWGPGEESLAEEVAVAAGLPDLVLPPTSIPLLAELLRAADLFIGNDSGPTHLAWLVGTRVVALYGPTDPTVNAPWGEGHVRISVPVAARDRRGKDPALMELITVDEVDAAVRRVLQGGAPAAGS
jgi:lipopolysaccharide heptosyltransferase I